MILWRFCGTAETLTAKPEALLGQRIQGPPHSGSPVSLLEQRGCKTVGTRTSPPTQAVAVGRDFPSLDLSLRVEIADLSFMDVLIFPNVPERNGGRVRRKHWIRPALT